MSPGAALSFEKAAERFKSVLTEKQRENFATCSLQDVYQSINDIQQSQGNRNALRDIARVRAFLEGMDEYRKVVEAFLNCTPFMGYVWVRTSVMPADTSFLIPTPGANQVYTPGISSIHWLGSCGGRLTSSRP